MRPLRCGDGFSLVEALIATTIMATGVSVLVGLAAMSSRSNRSAAAATLATILAMDRAGLLSSQIAAGGTTAVPLSPADALAVNAAGYSDFFDAGGAPLGSGPTVPSGAAFVRRWSVRSLPGSSIDARLLRVVVLKWPDALALTSDEARRSELVHLVIVEAGR